MLWYWCWCWATSQQRVIDSLPGSGLSWFLPSCFTTRPLPPPLVLRLPLLVCHCALIRLHPHTNTKRWGSTGTGHRTPGPSQHPFPHVWFAVYRPSSALYIVNAAPRVNKSMARAFSKGEMPDTMRWLCWCACEISISSSLPYPINPLRTKGLCKPFRNFPSWGSGARTHRVRVFGCSAAFKGRCTSDEPFAVLHRESKQKQPECESEKGHKYAWKRWKNGKCI